VLQVRPPRVSGTGPPPPHPLPEQPRRTGRLTPKRLAAFLAGIRYCGSTTPEAMHARILAAPAGARGDTGAAAVHVTRALVDALQALIVQIDVLTDQITEQLHAHADGHIFWSLPRAQALRAGRLLAEIGDARGRFPTPEALASLAGVAPRPDSRARAAWSGSAGPWTGNYATPWSSGPVTPDCRADGPPKSTAGLEPAATTIHTRCGCWPGPGCM
jgi:hypothetical protein